MVRFSDKNPAFSAALNDAAFVYGDKFIVIPTRNTPESLSILRGKTRRRSWIFTNSQWTCKYKQVGSFEWSECATIAAVGVVNVNNVSRCIVGGSNHSLAVIDMSTMTAVRTIPNAHSRSAHCIRLPMPLSANGYLSDNEPFVTCATDSTVRMFDVRTRLGCVSVMNGHTNVTAAVSASISPCRRYVAVGSEDSAIYVFDVRATSYVKSTHVCWCRRHH